MSILQDYTTNLPFRLAKTLKKDPFAISKRLAKNLNSKKFFKIKAVAPGFIKFFHSPEYLKKQVADILKKQTSYGTLKIGKNIKTQVEFISANPSSKLHIGNGRSAFYGDVLGNVLSRAGYKVEKEYYINDAKVSWQIQTLGATPLGRGTAY